MYHIKPINWCYVTFVWYFTRKLHIYATHIYFILQIYYNLKNLRERKSSRHSSPLIGWPTTSLNILILCLLTKLPNMQSTVLIKSNQIGLTWWQLKSKWYLLETQKFFKARKSKNRIELRTYILLEYIDLPITKLQGNFLHIYVCKSVARNTYLIRNQWLFQSYGWNHWPGHTNLFWGDHIGRSQVASINC